MKQLRFLFILAVLIIGVKAADAQKAIDRGYLKMEITDVTSDNEQMMAMADMLKNSSTEIYFTPEKAFTTANMMGGMSVTSVLVDLKTKENTMLMSMMGQKIKISMDEEELKEMQAGNDPNAIEYKHFENETKEILGFKCHKVQMSGEATQGATMTMWVTDKIKSGAHVTNGIQVDQLKGFPLQYIISMGGQIDMTMTATAFEKEVDESIFKLDTTGYKEMTMKEFMETMGAMGGGF